MSTRPSVRRTTPTLDQEGHDANHAPDHTENDAQNPECARRRKDGDRGDDDCDLQSERGLVATVVNFRSEFCVLLRRFGVRFDRRLLGFVFLHLGTKQFGLLRNFGGRALRRRKQGQNVLLRRRNAPFDALRLKECPLVGRLVRFNLKTAVDPVFEAEK